jgi:hypothetical protein
MLTKLTTWVDILVNVWYNKYLNNGGNAMRYLIPALIVGALISSPVAAQGVCGSREELVSRLENGYLESQVAIGLGSSGALIEIFVSKEKGTFSIIRTTPTGISCLMTAGDNWIDIQLEEDKGPAY